MSKVHPKKAKLRPARDVISRLRWSPGPLADNQVVFGYIDRINGTMEKDVEDYLPMSDGGDIPEHRMLYFRRVVDGDDAITHLSNNIIWDRAGRVDRVFDSGYYNKDVSKETIEEARAAIINMARLEEEKAERLEQKARVRAHRARSRAAERKVASAVPEHNVDSTSESRNRFQWKSIPWHHFDENIQQWKQGDYGHTSDKRKNLKNEGNISLTVLTWNVLSNIHPSIVTDGNEIGGHKSRWSQLAEAIHEQSPDIVALQEATPDFADQILAIDWVRSDYASSISPHDNFSVNPIGNLLLWKKSNVVASRLWACVDGIRWRACEATFRFGLDNVLVCANVHLPSDKHAVVRAGSKLPRQLARRRELSSIIGHLQTTESYLKRVESRTEINHLIMGDFNCSASELEDGAFAGGGYFQDFWSEIQSASSEIAGYTFDPIDNSRAASSSLGQRRIDRIYLNTGAELEPVRADVIHGKSKVDTIPPSDHYALCAQFLLRDSEPRALYNPLQYYNAWAANAPSSKDSMVAIILDSEEMEHIKGIYDSDSSLLSPHITLLYGFVELHHESLDLSIKAVKDSINGVFQEQPSSSSLSSISFSEESLDVFEHRSSATLVARPNVDYDGNKWLMQLYGSLRSRFRFCNDQENHSAERFTPHVSLGKFGFTSSARKVAAAQMGVMSGLNIPVRSVDVLERSPDGQFRSIASVPFSSLPNTPSKGLRHIISDTGYAVSSFFSEKSQIVLSIINQASRSASRSFENLHITSDVIPYGSAALDCALPKMSDLDVVIMLRTNHALISPSRFLLLANEDYLKRLMTCLRETHAVAKMRLRPIRSGLNILSVQIQPNLPPADIILCLIGHDGKPMDAESDGAFDSIQDNANVMDVLADVEAQTGGIRDSFSIKDVFCASLRLVKLWAWNRGVYGAKCGFLGGGSWAIFLAYIMKSIFITEQCGKESIFMGTKSLSEAAHLLTRIFFDEASRWPWPQPIALGTNQFGNQRVLLQPRLVVLSPSSASNLAKNSTISTCLVTAVELRRASTLAKCIIENDTKAACISTLESVISPLRLQELIASSPEIIALELVYNNEESLPSRHLPDDVEAWGCGQYLSFLVNLERKLDTSLLRPFSRAFKVQQEWKVGTSVNYSGTNREGFVWIVGVCGVLSKEERGAVEDVSSRIASCFGESEDNHGLDLSASVISSDDAIERIVS